MDETAQRAVQIYFEAPQLRLWAILFFVVATILLFFIGMGIYEGVGWNAFELITALFALGAAGIFELWRRLVLLQ